MKIPPESPIYYCNIHSVEQEPLLSKPKCSVCRALCTSNTAGASTTELQAPPKLPPQLLCGEERRAALRGDNGELEAGTPFPRCQCPQNKGFDVLSGMQRSTVGVGKTPHELLLLSLSSQRNNNKRAFGQECRYFFTVLDAGGASQGTAVRSSGQMADLAALYSHL